MGEYSISGKFFSMRPTHMRLRVVEGLIKKKIGILSSNWHFSKRNFRKIIIIRIFRSNCQHLLLDYYHKSKTMLCQSNSVMLMPW
jgi:hypothetical protein